ncbi:MAG: HD domain-containing protein [Deltaproteobacteria bacterium]|nr:HD domain-containing protein [Deltaproteobacteria bacterium]MBN2674487.1 HD domain-containing protein [Deltaproteobacteria bacterium]
MNINDLRKLVLTRLGEGATYDHCVATEKCMAALAARFGEDEHLWAMTGLAHDLDLNECNEDLSDHTLIAKDVLEREQAPIALINAVLGHNDKAPRTTRLAKALWVVDPATGMITASALVRPSRSTADLTVKSIKKRMKDKRFAAAVNRDQIRACESELQIPLDEFLQLCLTAMQP